MSRTITVTHRISDIRAKDGSRLRYIHAESYGAYCTPLRLNKGERGWIAIEPSDDPGSIHRLHLSNVEDIEIIPGSSIIVTTENTVYTLEKLPVDERKDFVVNWDKMFEEIIDGSKDSDLS